MYVNEMTSFMQDRGLMSTVGRLNALVGRVVGLVLAGVGGIVEV